MLMSERVCASSGKQHTRLNGKTWPVERKGRLPFIQVQLLSGRKSPHNLVSVQESLINGIFTQKLANQEQCVIAVFGKWLHNEVC